MWGLLRHEKIIDTQDLVTIETGYTCLFKAKDILKLCIKNLGYAILYTDRSCFRK